MTKLFKSGFGVLTALKTVGYAVRAEFNRCMALNAPIR